MNRSLNGSASTIIDCETTAGSYGIRATNLRNFGLAGVTIRNCQGMAELCYCLFNSNSGVDNGAGLSLTNTIAIIHDVVLEGNGMECGKIRFFRSIFSTILQNSFVNGFLVASKNGGGLFVTGGSYSVVLQKSQIRNNRAGIAGGGVYVDSGSNVQLSHSVVSCNAIQVIPILLLANINLLNRIPLA